MEPISRTYERLDSRITALLARIAVPTLLSGRFMRLTLLLLFVQMAGTITPLFLFPNETFTQFPIAPTLEGQYIIKNFVLIGAAMVVGATVRGGRIVPEPPSI